MATRLSVGFVLLLLGATVGIDHAFHSTHALGTTADLLIGAGAALVIGAIQQWGKS